jgi:hypothetical protein
LVFWTKVIAEKYSWVIKASVHLSFLFVCSRGALTAGNLSREANRYVLFTLEVTGVYKQKLLSRYWQVKILSSFRCVYCI